MSETGMIFNIQRFCLHDGPGIRTTVFLKGCPLSCIWCHNPESKQLRVQLSYHSRLCTGCRECENVCPNQVHDFVAGTHQLNYTNCVACGKCVQVCPTLALQLIGQTVSVKDIMDTVVRDTNYYAGSGGGVTISGGEPFFQPEFCLELLKACKEKKLHTCVETSGFCPWEVLKTAAQYTDLFLFDFKIGDSKKHRKYTSVTNEIILRNLELLDQMGASVILRCPLIPGINDEQEHFQSIVKYSKLKNVKAVEIMPYHTLGEGKAVKIGAEYLLKIPSVSEPLVSEWIQNIKRLGCEKIAYQK